MRFSRRYSLAAICLSLGTTIWAAGPVSSDLPKPSSPTLPMISGGAMATSSASGFSNGNGVNQTTSKSQAQLGGLPQPGNPPRGTVSSDLPANPGVPANLLPINFGQFGNPVAALPGAANPADMNRRVVATANVGEDKLTTGADDQYSTVIKVKPNGQITMIVVTIANMDVRRIQAKNVEELQKKDLVAFTEYKKYIEAE